MNNFMNFRNLLHFYTICKVIEVVLKLWRTLPMERWYGVNLLQNHQNAQRTLGISFLVIFKAQWTPVILCLKVRFEFCEFINSPIDGKWVSKEHAIKGNFIDHVGKKLTNEKIRIL